MTQPVIPVLPILDETIEIDLTPAGLAGAVAIARPFDLEGFARWQHSLKDDNGDARLHALRAVRTQLVTVNGLTLGKGAKAAAYDPDNALHVRTILARTTFVLTVAEELLKLAVLSDDEVKN